MHTVLKSLRLLVIDDHPVVRSGVSLLVQKASCLEIAGYAPTGREAIECAAALRPDVVLLDLCLPDMLAPEVARGIRSVLPSVRIIVFTAFIDHASLAALDNTLVDGCLLKDVTREALIDAVKRVSRGEHVVDPRITGDSSNAAFRGSLALTRREYEVLRRVAMGETNPEIACAIGFSRNTVKACLQTVFQKLGARNRVEVIRRGQEVGLL